MEEVHPKQQQLLGKSRFFLLLIFTHPNVETVCELSNEERLLLFYQTSCTFSLLTQLPLLSLKKKKKF